MTWSHQLSPVLVRVDRKTIKVASMNSGIGSELVSETSYVGPMFMSIGFKNVITPL